MSGIFISYRREDAAGHAGRLFDRLAQHFGRDAVFMDVAGIEPGVDFVEAIERAVGSCAVLIVVIGKQWAQTLDAAGNRRLEDPNDFVRLEAATALKRNVRVIPLLVEGAPLPSVASLPEDLRTLTRRNAFELRDGRWEADIGLLVNALEKALGAGTAPAGTARDNKAVASSRRRWAAYAGGAAVLGLALLAIAWWVAGGKDSAPEIHVAKQAPTIPPVAAPASPGTAAATTGPAQPSAAAAPAVTTPAVQDAKVPRLLGVQRESAAQLLDSAGLKLGTVTSREEAEKTAGTVLAQQPGAGTLVRPGTRVSIVLAAAPTAPEPQQPPAAQLEMPRFVGLPAATARARIAESGLQITRWLRQPVADLDQVDRVVWQRPAAGVSIEKGAGVEIAVGVQPVSPRAEVPAMVGLSMNEALNALEQAGLKLGRRSGKASAREPGTILRQSVAAGTRLAPGSTVDLVYAARQASQPIQPRDSSTY